MWVLTGQTVCKAAAYRDWGMVWVLTGQTECKAAAYRDWGDGVGLDWSDCV